MTQTAQEINHAEQNAKSWYQNIEEMVAKLKEAIDSDDDTAREEAETEINESPLSVTVRSGWETSPHGLTAEEYMILLTTGGPALRITGDLNEYNEPETATLEYQDWGTPWTEYREAKEETLLEYARRFYFGS